jgi:hypothetical protein
VKANNMKAFYNDPTLKAEAIAEMQAHIDTRQLVKGRYWRNGKGSFIGCAVKNEGVIGAWHMTFQEKYNIGKHLAELFDILFEGLPNKRAMRWPIEVYNAIQVGADVSKVSDEFLYWLLSAADSPLAFSFKDDEWGVWNAIKGVAALYADSLAGNEPDDAAKAAAWKAARAAAWEAGDFNLGIARASGASGAAARAAAWAVARAVEDVARAVVDAAAFHSAKRTPYIKMAEKLLELLAAAPMNEGAKR